ncbi:MAG: glycosyltransferase family 2 protein [bacterium]|nr:glycosyltransferase family 2 protein [bacterium]
MLNRNHREGPNELLPHYGVGIVNYRTYEDLVRCISSVKRQSHAPARIVLIDGDSTPGELEALQRQFPELEAEARPNHGFAAGANRALAILHRPAPHLEFMLVLNPDVELAPDFAERVLEDMLEHPRAGLASGKLVRPGEVAIDSTGIVLPRNRRPRDRGSEELDLGQYDREEDVFAASGAVLMLRTAALADLEVDGEIFDEDFFMYHEDTDLAWRAHNLGWRARYVHRACAIHTRRWRPHHRFEVAPHIRRHSFKNHYLQIIKNDTPRDFLRDLPAILVWEGIRLAYAILRDRAMLRSYLEVARLVPRAWRKRGIIRARMKQTNNPSAVPSPITRR